MDVWFDIISFVGHEVPYNRICKEINSICGILTRKKMNEKYSLWKTPIDKNDCMKGYDCHHFLIQLMAYNDDWNCIQFLLRRKTDPELIMFSIKVFHMYNKIEYAMILFKKYKDILLDRKGTIQKNKSGFVTMYYPLYSFYAYRCDIKCKIPTDSSWNCNTALGFVIRENLKYFSNTRCRFLTDHNYLYDYHNRSIDVDFYTRKTYEQLLVERGPPEDYNIDTFFYFLFEGSTHLIPLQIKTPLVFTRTMIERLKVLFAYHGYGLKHRVPPILLYTCREHLAGHVEHYMENQGDENIPTYLPHEIWAYKNRL